MPDDRSRQVLDVVERYYHYSNVYRDLGDTFRYLGTEEEISRGLNQLHTLRRDYLGPDLAEALFGEEERMMRVTLENMRIQSDPALTEAQKRSGSSRSTKRRRATNSADADHGAAQGERRDEKHQMQE